jgi:Domain of unknown function (DUF397)
MDVTAVAWRTSSYSGDNGGACVEVGATGPAIAVRDSKYPNGPQLAFAPGTWKAFTSQLKADRLTRDELLTRLAGLRQAPIRSSLPPSGPLPAAPFLFEPNGIGDTSPSATSPRPAVAISVGGQACAAARRY